MRAFAPFNMAVVLLSRAHASQPYVSMEHTAVLYTFNFSPSEMSELNTLRSLPMRVAAMAILRFISHSSLPSAVKIDPKYLNLYTLLSALPSQNTWSLTLCAAVNFISLTFFEAHVPVKFCTSGFMWQDR